MKDINVRSTGSCGRGFTYWDREITKKQYEAAQANGGRLTKSDVDKVLTDSERWGYGASATGTFEQDGKYYVHCSRANSCD
jgi:hypothetical protein